MPIHVVWLRNDLRVTDNRALFAACQEPDAHVLAVYIATPGQWQSHDMAPMQAEFIYQHLQQVQQQLAERNIPLFYHQCDDFSQAVDWLSEFCRQQQASALFFNRQYELNEARRDNALLEQLSIEQVSCYGFDDALLLSPGSVTTADGTMFKVYTAFRKAFIKRLINADLSSLPAPELRQQQPAVAMAEIEPFDYPRRPLNDLFAVGEQVARQRLRAFCCQRVADYAQQRDFPARAGTSHLSAYLAIGVLSPRQCFNRLRTEFPNLLDEEKSGAFSWLNELIWREFYHHLLAAWPQLCRHHPFIAWTKNIVWRNDQQAFVAWQQGMTGYPIVDAAMRQLRATGWMHNRLRMIVASFLVKDLLIDWRWGERYFSQQLIDGCLAANNGGWQWAASTGCDAAPYFRIFNPTTQGQRFDPQGEFIRHWVPELATVPDSDIHQPHTWADKHHRTLNYPSPLVYHASARVSTLAAFDAAKNAQKVEK